MTTKIYILPIQNFISISGSMSGPSLLETHLSELRKTYQNLLTYLEVAPSSDEILKLTIELRSILEEIVNGADKGWFTNTSYVKQLNSSIGNGEALLDSIIAVLEVLSLQPRIREYIHDLGWKTLYKTYEWDFEELIKQTLLFYWLKREELVYQHIERHYSLEKTYPIQFTPSDEDLDRFFEENRSFVLTYIKDKLNVGRNFQISPMNEYKAKAFYFYHQKLANIQIQSEKDCAS